MNKVNGVLSLVVLQCAVGDIFAIINAFAKCLPTSCLSREMGGTNWNIINKKKRKQNITRDIEVKNNLTMVRGEWGSLLLESEE